MRADSSRRLSKGVVGGDAALAEPAGKLSDRGSGGRPKGAGEEQRAVVFCDDDDFGHAWARQVFFPCLGNKPHHTLTKRRRASRGRWSRLSTSFRT